MKSWRPFQWASLLCVGWRASATEDGLDDEAIGKWSRKGGAMWRKARQEFFFFMEAVKLELLWASWLINLGHRCFILYTLCQVRATKVKTLQEHHELSSSGLDFIFRESVADTRLKRLIP